MQLTRIENATIKNVTQTASVNSFAHCGFEQRDDANCNGSIKSMKTYIKTLDPYLYDENRPCYVYRKIKITRLLDQYRDYLLTSSRNLSVNKIVFGQWALTNTQHFATMKNMETKNTIRQLISS